MRERKGYVIFFFSFYLTFYDFHVKINRINSSFHLISQNIYFCNHENTPLPEIERHFIRNEFNRSTFVYISKWSEEYS